jgi:hypothetical protein
MRRNFELIFSLSSLCCSSWHDDPDVKYATLEAAAFSFRAKHGRDPTFWLDKVCIHQSRIGDGLRSLPVNVMVRSNPRMCGNDNR